MGSLAPLMGLGACVLVLMAMFEGALARDHPPKVVKCEIDRYKECYKIKHRCPNVCSSSCVVDCVACKPVCSCDLPGAVCQDPRFVGGDGITFYFHGKKNKDFCLVSDSNLHINAHFIGKRGPNMNMKRDFTWVQSIGILFSNHQIYVGAQKTSTWKESANHLSLSFNGEPILLPPGKGSKWVSTSAPGVSIQRSSATNGVTVHVDGNFKIDATVVPITDEESRVHGYGVNEEEDCFAHLELGFKFYSLTEDVNGVLGQTYGKKYISRVKMGAAMPVMGGNKEFAATSLFIPDCAVARFQGLASGMGGTDFASLSCGSGMDGLGVVCKR